MNTTPGAWKLEVTRFENDGDLLDGDPKSIRVVAEDAGRNHESGNTIAILPAFDERAVADGKAIAAVPQMIEALRAVLSNDAANRIQAFDLAFNALRAAGVPVAGVRVIHE
jgi:hypothetical protein